MKIKYFIAGFVVLLGFTASFANAGELDGAVFKCKILTMQVRSPGQNIDIDFRTKSVSSPDPGSLPDKKTISQMFRTVWKETSFNIRLNDGKLIMDGVQNAPTSIPLPYTVDEEALSWGTGRPLRIKSDGVDMILETSGTLDMISLVSEQSFSVRASNERTSGRTISQCAPPR